MVTKKITFPLEPKEAKKSSKKSKIQKLMHSKAAKLDFRKTARYHGRPRAQCRDKKQIFLRPHFRRNVRIR